MTIPSPTRHATALVNFAVTVGGIAIDSAINVMSIELWSGVNRLPKLRLVIRDGDPSKGTFAVSETATFLPGKPIAIAAGYDGRTDPIFSGIILRHGIEIGAGASSLLVVEAADEAIRMTVERRSAIYEKVKDSELIGTLIGNARLKPSVTATSTANEEIVQCHCTDWDLMVSRAEANGLLVMVADGRVTVAAPDTGKDPVLALRHGDSILALDVAMDATTQLAPSAIRSYAWDPATQAVIGGPAGSAGVTEPGNLSSAELAKVLGVTSFPQETAAAADKGALAAWSTAELRKSALSKIRGTVRFQGSALAKVGTMVQLEGLGARFNGKAFVGGVHHRIAEERWLTTVEIGLSPSWFAATTPDIAAPAAAGLIPPVSGLQTGIVRQVAKDPAGDFRVRIELPLLRSPDKGVWARLATFYASSGFGAVVFPEVGDEVIVGFMGDDPRTPVILGSVYSRKRAPAFSPGEQNETKALVTRSKLEMVFDEKDKVMTFKTPGGHSVVLDDKTGAVTIKDSNGNSATLSKSGISLVSTSDLTVKAEGNIAIEAGRNLTMTAKSDASLKAVNVAAKAEVKFSAEGQAQAELTASGTVTIRGGLVNIN